MKTFQAKAPPVPVPAAPPVPVPPVGEAVHELHLVCFKNLAWITQVDSLKMLIVH